MAPRVPEIDDETAAWLVAFVGRLAGVDDHEAADLSQEAWLVALAEHDRRPARLRPWLAGVARNLAANARRRDARRAQVEREAARRPLAEEPIDDIERAEAVARVVSCVGMLTDEQREALVLRYETGLSIAAIAKRLNVGRETVRSRLKRALNELRRRLRPDRSARAWRRAAARLAGTDRARWPRLLWIPLVAAALWFVLPLFFGWNPLDALLAPADVATNRDR